MLLVSVPHAVVRQAGGLSCVFGQGECSSHFPVLVNLVTAPPQTAGRDRGGEGLVPSWLTGECVHVRVCMCGVGWGGTGRRRSRRRSTWRLLKTDWESVPWDAQSGWTMTAPPGVVWRGWCLEPGVL